MTYFSDGEITARARATLSTLSDLRAVLVADALSLVGLEPTMERYQDELYPHDPKSQRKPLALRQSSCGITVEHADRAAGVDDPRLSMPYGERAVKGGVLYPLSLSVDIARRAGCWKTPQVRAASALPIEGDAVIVGNPGGAAGVWLKGGGFGGAHIFRVIAVEPQPTAQAVIVHSVDGGQPGIHLRTRALVWCGPNGDELWAASLGDDGAFVFDSADMRPTKGRRVFGWVDVDGLPRKA